MTANPGPPNMQKLTLTALLLALALSRTAAAQPAAEFSATQLGSLLQAHAYPLDIEDGALTGPGAAFLDAAAVGVQFVAFGEWHNRRAVHAFGGALFRLLHERHGFDYLAIEEDPYLGQLASRAARDGGEDAMIDLARRYPNAFHLLTEDELEMIGGVGQLSTAPTDPVWGLNQVFGAAHVFERLVEIAPDAEARAVAEELLAEALEYEGERFQQNKTYMAEVVQPEDFERLRATFHPPAGSEADFLIAQAALSHEIYAAYFIQPKPPIAALYASNEARETNMKHLFAERYREAQAAGVALPKALAMFGHLHLFRGHSERTDLLTLGNMLSELALFNGMESLHIYTFPDLPEAREDWQGVLVRELAAVAERAPGGPADAVVVDLRPLRPLAIARNPEHANLDPNVRRLILGYDLFVYLRDGEPGSLERLRTPNFRWYPSGG